MVEVASGSNSDIFGLYELSDDGTVLYSRSRNESGLVDPGRETIGQDYFRDIARFQNIEDLRRHFRQFLTGGRSADTFTFDCFLETGVVKARIFMTRAYETDHDHSGGIVIMDIRKEGS